MQLSLKIPAKAATVLVNSEEEREGLVSLGTQFTCFAGAQVQILTQKARVGGYIRSELNLRHLHVQIADIAGSRHAAPQLPVFVLLY